MALAYYNEIDPYAAQWLRNLIDAGHIAPGDVDERDIREVRPTDLVEYTQCHFFAGVGVWSHSLRLAGWPDHEPIWTGSCPCQPFSGAGSRRGFDDERHLRPFWHHLIRFCGPTAVLGEQVASRDGLAWLDLVHADLEGTHYACRAVDLCAAGVGAPHRRQRLWWAAERLADTNFVLSQQGGALDGRRSIGGDAQQGARSRGGSLPDLVGDASLLGRQGRQPEPGQTARGVDARAGATHHVGHTSAARLSFRERVAAVAARRGLEGRATEQPSRALGRLADAGSRQLPQPVRRSEGRDGARSIGPDDTRRAGRPNPTNGFWQDPDWLFCRDENWRPVEPGSSPLAHGAPNRVGKLRAYGNAIVPQVAAEFIRAAFEW